jgi:hypothetical protein
MPDTKGHAISEPAVDPLDEDAEPEALFVDDPSLLALVRLIKHALAANALAVQRTV